MARLQDIDIKQTSVNDCNSRFRGILRNPSFFLMLECSPKSLPPDSRNTRELFRFILDDSRIFATAITDRLDNNKCRASEEYSALAQQLTSKPVVNFISGKEQTFDGMTECLSHFRSKNLTNFVAVTGNYVPPEKDKEPNDFPGKYLDAIDILNISEEAGKSDCMGATVNPFKYSNESACAQYAKLVRKINNGAQFIIAQSGWDAKKYQELLWFMRSRELFIPLIARITIPPAEASSLPSDILSPGIQIPMLISTELKNECKKYNQEAFFDVQATKAAFIAAGCQLMGYSGLQITGIKNTYELENFLDKFDSVLAHYRSYASWAKAWNTKYEGNSLVPFSNDFISKMPFYLFKNLLSPQVRDFHTETAIPAFPDIGSPSLSDKLHFMLADEDTPQWLKTPIQKWLGKEESLLPNTSCFGIGNSSCPKRLTLGPCGNSTADGTCEATNGKCFFERIIRIATWKHKIELLENKKKQTL